MFSDALSALEMTVTVNGEQMDARFKPGDMIRFERHSGRPITQMAATDDDGNMTFKLEDLAYLAWAALTRTDQIDGDFDAFLDGLDDIDMTGVEEMPDPTHATA